MDREYLETVSDPHSPLPPLTSVIQGRVEERAVQLAGALRAAADRWPDLEVPDGIESDATRRWITAWPEVQAPARHLIEALYDGDEPRSDMASAPRHARMVLTAVGVPPRSELVSVGETLAMPAAGSIFVPVEDVLVRRALLESTTALRFGSWHDETAVSGHRIVPAVSQPSGPGHEWEPISAGVPDLDSVAVVADVIERIGSTDTLAAVTLATMVPTVLVTAVSAIGRRAGSVSDLFGMCWLDANAAATDPEAERAHLVGQVIHEATHGKLNAIETAVPLFDGDGNHRWLFSPWRGCDRPLRQVVHALVTFAAGACAMARALRAGAFQGVDEMVVRHVEDEVQLSVEGADILLRSGGLTPSGEALVGGAHRMLLAEAAGLAA